MVHELLLYLAVILLSGFKYSAMLLSDSILSTRWLLRIIQTVKSFISLVLISNESYLRETKKLSLIFLIQTYWVYNYSVV